MSTSNKHIERLVEAHYLDRLAVPKGADMDTQLLQDAWANMAQAQAALRAETQPKSRRMTMRHPIFKIATAAVILASTCIGLILFDSTGSGLAFAQVIDAIRGGSYTFTLRAEYAMNMPVNIMVQEPGLMRMETKTGIGDVSCIMDAVNNKTLILMHEQKTGISKTLGPETYVGEMAIFALCLNPIETLWNLQDGSEVDLGIRDIRGMTCQGFGVELTDDASVKEISVWADVATARPVYVELVSRNKAGDQTVTWIIDTVYQGAELDAASFALSAPAGYALVHEQTLEAISRGGLQSSEADKVLTVLDACRAEDYDQALEALLTVNWGSPIEFANEVHLFTLTETGYVTLVPADQQRVVEDIMSDCSSLRPLAFDIIAKAQAYGDSAEAEQYLNAGTQLGQLLCADPDGMLIVRLVGWAIQKLTLGELTKLYERTGQQDLLQQARATLAQIEAEAQSIKRKAQVQ